MLGNESSFIKHTWETRGKIHTYTHTRRYRTSQSLHATLQCNFPQTADHRTLFPMKPLVRLRQQSKAQVSESDGPGFKCQLCVMLDKL